MAREAANRRREMLANIETTIDSTLTLIETILNKLELVMFDYRGLDDLKLELNLVQNLLRRARFLKRSQSSVLFPFFERLRHFYFLLRKESTFVYEMVAEIAKFREIVDGFRREFCELNTSLLDAALDKLPAGVDWRKLKLELKLVRMFYQCAINGRDSEGNDFFLSDVKTGVDENAKQLYYCLVKLEASGKGLDLGLDESLASFRESLTASCENTKVWVRDLYSGVSNPMLTFSSHPWFCSELIGFLDYLLECLRGIMDWGEASDPTIKELIDPLLKNLKFLKSFVLFVTFWVEKLQILENFLLYCQVSAIHAACLGYMLWFYSDDDCVLRDLVLKGSELVEKTKPDNDQVTQKYVEILMTSRQSRPSSFVLEVQEMHVMADFIDSLVDKLPELLAARTGCMNSLDNTVWILGDGLELCRTFLKQQKMFNGLSQDEKDVLRDLVYEGAMVIFQLYMFRREERLAEEIKVRIFQLAEKADPLKAKLTRKLKRQHTPLLEDDKVVGLDTEAEELKNILIAGSNSRELEIAAIVGMVGVGKTTLAKKVFHDSVVINHFKFCAWCNVSRARSIDNMLIEILHCIVPYGSFCDSDDGQLAELLRGYLERERYLVVLDNIWEYSEAWNVLEGCFPDQYNGSKILLTGLRNHPTINCQYTIKLRQLSDDMCLELLRQKLAGRDQEFLQFQPLWHVAKLCRGLPSNVVIVAGILSDSGEVVWKEVVASMMKNSHFPINEYLNYIWELGYQHLPDYLKPCLHYMAAFPVGYEISVKRLLWLWLAERFVKQNVWNVGNTPQSPYKMRTLLRKDLEDTAEDYIVALVRKNFVMVTKQGSIGKAKTCRIHDFVHQFCLLKSKERNFLQQMGEDNDFSDLDNSQYLQRLFIYSQPKDFAESSIFTSRLNSLLFHSKAASLLATTYTLPFSFCAKLLEVLDLGQINLGFVFPDEITALVQLRFLAVRGLMKAVPRSIVNLSNLETLLLTTRLSVNNQGDFQFPGSLLFMRNLKHLHVQGCLVNTSFAERYNSEYSGSVLGLLTCSTLKLTDVSIGTILRKFPRIRKLKLFLLLVSRRSSFVNLGFLHQLQSLKLNLDDGGLTLTKFRFPSYLKELTLQHFSWSTISTIRGLYCLEALKLLQTNAHGEQVWNMGGARSTGTRGRPESQIQVFPRLKFLKLKDSDIVRWESCRNRFPRLQSLVLEGCRQLQELPRQLEFTRSLKLIKVQNCSISVNDLVREIEKEQNIWGNEGLRVLYLS